MRCRVWEPWKPLRTKKIGKGVTENPQSYCDHHQSELRWNFSIQMGMISDSRPSHRGVMKTTALVMKVEVAIAECMMNLKQMKQISRLAHWNLLKGGVQYASGVNAQLLFLLPCRHSAHLKAMLSLAVNHCHYCCCLYSISTPTCRLWNHFPIIGHWCHHSRLPAS